MKLFQLFAVAALFLAGFLSQAHAAANTSARFFNELAAGKKLTVVVYGTSLTHGGAWATAMKQWFDAKSPGNITFINSGGPGQNSDWGLKNLKTKVLDHKPDLVLIEFSYNDASDKFKMPVKNGETNLDKMVKAIRSENSNTCIVLQVMNDNWDAPNGKGSASHRPKLEEYNENYRSYAKEHSLPLLDHYPTWKKLKETDLKKFQTYVPDGTHPTKEGSLAVTWPTIKSWLETSK